MFEVLPSIDWTSALALVGPIEFDVGSGLSDLSILDCLIA